MLVPLDWRETDFQQNLEIQRWEVNPLMQLSLDKSMLSLQHFPLKKKKKSFI